MDNLSEVMAAGLQCHQAGDWAQAEEIYARVLAANPKFPDARHLFGLLLHQQGRHEQAIEQLQQAASDDPTNAFVQVNLGEVFRKLGRLEEALACGRRAAEIRSDLAPVHFSLGSTLFGLGRWAEAEACFRRVLQSDPKHFESANNLGAAAAAQGKLALAIESYQRAMQLRPEHDEVHFNLALVFELQQKPAEAEAGFRQTVRLNPDHGRAWNSLGMLLKDQGRCEESLSCYEYALRLRPNAAEVHNNRAAALQALRRFDDALASYSQALSIQPNSAETHYNLGLLLHERGQFNDSQDHYREALRLRPDFTLAWNNLGTTLKIGGQLDAAVDCFAHAVHLDPTNVEAQNNLSTSWQEQGRMPEAIDGYRKALALDLGNVKIISNLLLALNYNPHLTPTTLYEEHFRWARMFVAPTVSTTSGKSKSTRPQTSKRPLRVGYMSPNFHRHAVASFVEPILAQHDRSQVEAVLFGEIRWTDDVTQRLQNLAHGWHNTCGLTDEQLSDLIRSEKIDLLVDLAGHTNHNRLGVMNLRPAAVQATYLGYPNTTGLQAVDYRLTDAVVDPPGSEALYTEKLVRLSPVFCCYQPTIDAPEVNPLPAKTSDRITFGSLHNLAKLNGDVLDVWSRVILSVPGSRLLIFRDSLQAASRERLRREFAQRGLDEIRVELRGSLLEGQRHWSIYHEVDISLDAFPWGGHTTACESLWMGVPVITLLGDRAAGRMVASVLSSLGLSAWTVANADEYVRLAMKLAADLDQLARWRSRLRPVMRDSPLCDARQFTRGLEHAYCGFFEG